MLRVIRFLKILKANRPAQKLGLFAIGLFPLIGLSCEDVIDINLNSVEPRVVIEGTITHGWGPHPVRISKTDDYFIPGNFTPVSEAIVTVTDDAGRSFDYQEIEPGIYQNEYILGFAGRTYYLSVTVEGATYTASSTMPETIPIDSLAYEYQPGDEFEDEGYLLHCYFQDPEGQDDYCRIKIWNGNTEKWLGGYFLYNGDWSDGNYIDYNYFWNVFEPGDTLTVGLMTIEKQIHDYYLTLSQVVASKDGEMPQGVPANPNTNLSGGALGYFAAFAIDWQSIVIPSAE
jgi:hypothetical protein